jgi:hypothetical protein
MITMREEEEKRKKYKEQEGNRIKEKKGIQERGRGENERKETRSVEVF